MIKIHKHLLESVGHALREVIQDGKSPGPVIERLQKSHPKWGSRDRKFFAETVYELIRWWRRDWFLLNQEPNFETGDIIKLWGVHQMYMGNALPDWSELAGLKLNSEKMPLAIEHSIPDWLFAKGQAQFKDSWPQILPSLNAPAPVDIRVNRLKTTREKLQQALLKLEIDSELIHEVPDGLSLKSRKNLTKSELYLGGHFEFQDRSSQLIAPFLDPKPGEKIIDLCAGAGGKTLHLATLMKNKGEILACDIFPKKLDELKKRTSRNGIDIVKTALNDQPLKTAPVDKVLLDVPCSGLGVLKRNPHSKWKMSEQEIESIKPLQQSLLNQGAKLVKPGGVLVYATCSFLFEENEEQITRFLETQSESWEKQAQLRINPGPDIGDSFFAVRLVKK
jgi:16S rRNA (cytosine967-C5)-methyltransferase